MLYFVVFYAAAFLGSSIAAHSEPDGSCFSMGETREAIRAQGLFEPFQLMRSAALRLHAEAIGVKLCRWHETLVYAVSLLRHDGHIIYVFINAQNGQTIGSKNQP